MSVSGLRGLSTSAGCEEMGLDSVSMCVSRRSALSFLHSLLDRGLSHVTTKFYAAANSSSCVGFGNPFLSHPLARLVQQGIRGNGC